MCASHVSTCGRGVWYRDLDVRGISRFAWLRLYESLRTYVANIDLVGDLLQGIYPVRASELLITKCVGYPI